MISKQQYLEIMKKEFAIMKHLGEKLTEEQLAFRPTAGQRSLQELLQYLTHIFVMGADSVATGDSEAYKKYVNSPMPNRENFSLLLDEEMAKFLEFVEPLSEADLEVDIKMWGRTQSRAMHLIGLLGLATAYKMQMFLYMKQAGAEHLNSTNLWAGMDTPPKE